MNHLQRQIEVVRRSTLYLYFGSVVAVLAIGVAYVSGISFCFSLVAMLVVGYFEVKALKEINNALEYSHEPIANLNEQFNHGVVIKESVGIAILASSAVAFVVGWWNVASIVPFVVGILLTCLAPLPPASFTRRVEESKAQLREFNSGG